MFNFKHVSFLQPDVRMWNSLSTVFFPAHSIDGPCILPLRCALLLFCDDTQPSQISSGALD